MKRLKALKDMYINGVMVLRGQFYVVDDNVARQHIRDHKAVEAPRQHPLVAANRRTKIVEPKGKK